MCAPDPLSCPCSPGPAPGRWAQPLRGPRGGPAPGRVGHRVRRPLEHPQCTRRVPPPGLRSRAQRPGALPLRPRLRAHPAGRRALRWHRGRAGELRPCWLGSPQLPTPRGRGRAVRRCPGVSPRLRPLIFLQESRVHKVQIHTAAKLRSAKVPDSRITGTYLL